MPRQFLRLLLICCVLSAVSNFPSGFTNSSINTAGQQLIRFVRDSFEQRGRPLAETELSVALGIILNSWYVGQILGAMGAPGVLDKYGRKNAYIIACTTMTLGSCIQLGGVLLMRPEVLIVGRFLAAICSPLSDASMIMYFQESTPLQFRGTISFLGGVGYFVMCVVGATLGMHSVLGFSLPLLLAVSVAPQIFSVFFLLWIPETPKYLMIIRKDRASALKSLVFFQGESPEHENTLNVYLNEASIDKKDKRSTSLRELFSTWYLRHVIVVGACVMVLTLPFYTMLQSSTHFLLSVGIDPNLAEVASTLMMTLNAISGAFGTTIIDRFPRRLLVVIFGAANTAFLALFAVFSLWPNTKYLAMLSLFGFTMCYGAIIGPLKWFIAPTMVAQRHRSTMYCLVFVIQNLLIVLTNTTSVALYDIMGANVLILVFVLPSVVSLIYVLVHMPETLRREPHDIVLDMHEKYHNKSSADPDSEA